MLPPFGKEMRIRLAVCSLCIMCILVILVISHFGFEGVTMVSKVPSFWSLLTILPLGTIFNGV